MTTPFPAGAPSAACLREKRPPILYLLRLDALWRSVGARNKCALAEQGGADQSTGDLLAPTGASRDARALQKQTLEAVDPRAALASVSLDASIMLAGLRINYSRKLLNSLGTFT